MIHPLNRSRTGPGQTLPERTSSFGHFFPQVPPQSSPSVYTMCTKPLPQALLLGNLT